MTIWQISISEHTFNNMRYQIRLSVFMRIYLAFAWLTLTHLTVIFQKQLMRVNNSIYATVVISKTEAFRRNSAGSKD